jgi:hypothetical protein
LAHHRRFIPLLGYGYLYRLNVRGALFQLGSC